MKKGFTLVQVSVLLLIASLVILTVLPSTQKALDANRITSDRLNDLMRYYRVYMASNGALPCPADATLATGAANYGVAAANSGSSTDCTGSTPAANYVDATNNVAIGMVPYKTLGIPRDLVYDGWGRVITYAVDTAVTGSCWATPATGAITVTDNGNAQRSVIALVSHGSNGHGAWIPLAGSSGTGSRLNNNSSNSSELTNAHVDSSFAATSTLTNFVITTPGSTFDDTIAYKSAAWTMNARSSVAAGAGGSTISGVSTPTTGFYSYYETLYSGLSDTTTIPFTVTLDSAVTVSIAGGTPRLALTATSVGGGTVSLTGNSGSGATGYANYVSGSGTTTLTFSYPVQATDMAPNGLTIANSISLNGGTITSLCANSFSPPTLTGVIIPKVQAITASGTWTVPVDWSNTYNAVLGVGSGGNGAAGTATAGGAGGGGGAAALSTGLSSSAGASVPVTIGSGGGTSKTMFSSTSFLNVDYGKNASGTTAGAGGTTAGTTISGTGSLEYAGGTGGNNGGTTRGGGGGGGGAAMIGSSASSTGGVGRNGGNGANTGGGGGGGGGTWVASVSATGGNGATSGGAGGQGGRGWNNSNPGNRGSAGGGNAGNGTAGYQIGGGGGGGSNAASTTSGSGGNGSGDDIFVTNVAPAGLYAEGAGGGGSGGANGATSNSRNAGNGGGYGGGGGGSGGATGTPGTAGSGTPGLIIVWWR